MMLYKYAIGKTKRGFFIKRCSADKNPCHFVKDAQFFARNRKWEVGSETFWTDRETLVKRFRGKHPTIKFNYYHGY